MEIKILPSLRLAALFLVVGAHSAWALDASGIDIHGSVSLTASSSETYNYLGDTKGAPSLNLVDAIINAAHRFENGTRVGAQLYGYKVGKFRDVTLDWANLDYAVNSGFGVRLGRNKMPLGLYNDSQDLDSTRSFASLPFTFYSKSYRATNGFVDGAAAYGTWGAGKAGSLEYQAYYGTKPSIPRSTPLITGSDNIARATSWEFKKPIYGCTLFWDTPLSGLRLGYSHLVNPEGALRGVLAPTTELRREYLMLPAVVDTAMGAGTWNNSGSFAGTIADIIKIRMITEVYSLEWNHNKWNLAAEYKVQDMPQGLSSIPALRQLGMPADRPFKANILEWYVMTSYQATKRLGCGVYYSYENRANKTVGSSSDPTLFTKDWAAALSYAVTSNWTMKAEIHALNGRSQIFIQGDDNQWNGTKNRWAYYVVKSTLSF